ncbi:putative lipoprotein, rSAM/lipoprotein system [Cesiribacter andamanensis AMV16]|uniref:Putative lipoprotein, rSAM/lipoprotein system n=2 Tax=Cesiribacter TaxID=1133570 RepID=M7N245_9BACT|nr:putative lipoprotein, rSAM/lipoprotein system [Cesiribacter andamanensis AMV16]
MAILLMACSSAQIMKTSLRVTVLDELGNPVEGATIQVYTNDKDYRASTNPAVPMATTNAKGMVTIKDLDAKPYFLDVVKGDKDNRGAGYQTDVLQANRINKINIIIE